MIARIWEGKVLRTKRNEFLRYIKQTGLPGLKKTKGNLAVQIMVRDTNTFSHFMILSFWDSVDSIKNFTGLDYKKARLYPMDIKFLHGMKPIFHYEVLVNENPNYPIRN